MNTTHLQKQPIRPDYELILDSLPHGVLVVGIDGTVEYVNSVVEQIFQTSASYFKRKGLSKVLASESPIFELMKQAIKGGVPVNEYRVPVYAYGKGETHFVDVFASPLADKNDLILLTLRNRSVEDRLDRQLDYQGAAMSVNGLAAMLGHEIKNPLSGIRGAAQLLGQNATVEEKGLAELIQSETDRIVKIVDQMEVFSDDRPFVPEPVNLHVVLEQVRKLAENGFAQNIEFSENYDPSLPDVAGSYDELLQVFLNLVKNAAEAFGDNASGHIAISSAYRSGVRYSGRNKLVRGLPLEFSITDNAGGISSEIKDHMFDPFVTTKRNGSGLGLAMVARITERHGGLVECNSTKDGTRFSLLLPAWNGGNHD